MRRHRAGNRRMAARRDSEHSELSERCWRLRQREGLGNPSREKPRERGAAHVAYPLAIFTMFTKFTDLLRPPLRAVLGPLVSAATTSVFPCRTSLVRHLLVKSDKIRFAFDTRPRGALVII
jgi:hypothetical protein